MRGLLDGGVDVLLIDTVFDTMNSKAAAYAKRSAEVFKNDLNVHTPTEPNYGHMTFGLTAGMGIYQSPYAFNSDSKFTYVVPVNI